MLPESNYCDLADWKDTDGEGAMTSSEVIEANVLRRSDILADDSLALVVPATKRMRLDE